MYQDPIIRKPAESFHTRNAERTPISFAALLLRDGAPDLEVKVRNFSRRGFSVVCDEALPLETRFKLRLPGVGDTKSLVKWNRGRRYGCEFERELTPPQLLEILRSPYFPRQGLGDRVRRLVARFFPESL